MEQPMMQNGMPGQAPVASMQRPQPGNFGQQIFAKIIADLKNTMGQFNGSWQATLDPRIRANLIMQLTTTLSMLEPEIGKCLQIAQRFELNSILNSQNRQQYEQSINGKLEEIRQKRAQKAQATLQRPEGLQQQIGGMNGQDGNLMQAQQPGNMNAAMHQGFPAQLQRPMQPSMLQPQGQRPTTMDPSFLMNRGGATAPMAMNMNVSNAGSDMTQPNGQQQENSIEVQQLAQQFMAQMPEAKRNDLRKQLFAQMNEQQRNAYTARGSDPLKTFVISKARQEIAKKKAQQGQSAQMLQQGQRQQFDQVNMNNLNLDQQQAGNNFSLSHLYGQQANALKMQESGEQVVPVSDNNLFGNAGSNGQNNMNMLAQPGKAPGLDAQRMLLQRQQLQSQKQLQDRLVQQRNDAVRAQALNAQQQAQANGLALNNTQLGVPNALNGQLNSPAMSMLNRPMQGAEGQNFGQGVQNFNLTGTDANTLAQHHQNMVNQNNGAGLPQAPPQAMSSEQLTNILDNLPPETRNKILSMPPLERNMALHRFRLAQDARVAMQGRRAAPLQTPNPKLNNAGGNMPMNAMNMIPPQVGLSNNGQPNAEQFQRQRQQQMIRNQAMLSRPLPRHIANRLQLNIPPNVQRWGQLRQHILMNQGALAPDMPAKLMQAMDAHFQANPAELQQGIREVLAVQQNAQRGAGMTAANPNGGAQFPGQPNVPLSTPVAPMQPARVDMNGPPANFVPQVTPQEVAHMRALRNIGPQVSDEQIRHAMMQRKMAGMAQAKQAQASMQQQQQQQQQQNNTATMNNAVRQPPPAVKRMPVQPSASGATAKPHPVKRTATSDEVVEIPNPNAAKKTPAMTAQQKMMQMPAPTAEQLAKLPENERKRIQQQYANMQRMSQQASQQGAVPMKPTMSQQNVGQAIQNGKQQQKMLLTKLYTDLGALPAKGAPVKAEPAQISEIRVLFRKMWKPLQALEQTLSTAYKTVPGFSDEQAKRLLQAKHLFDLNMADGEGNIKDYLSANLTTFKQISHMVMQYYTEISKHAPKKNMQGEMGAPTAQANMQAPAAAQAAVPMTATKSTIKGSSKPPSAPVDDKKFWSGVASPHGVPKYDNMKPDLTADQLKMPPGKKRKTGPTTSQPTTPAQTSTPSATPKLPSGKIEATKPVARPAQPEVEKVRVRCPHVDSCDASITGFETEAQLKAHMETVHAPIGDPYEFLMSATADLLKVVESKAKAMAPKKPQAAAMAKLPSKQSVKSLASKPAAADVKPAVPVDEDMKTTMIKKLGYAPKLDDLKDDSAKHTALDLEEDFMSSLGDILRPFLDDGDILSNSMSMDIDDWGLELPNMTSPELTPGNGSDSSRDSDISANDQMRINLTWDASGTGELSLPEFFKIDDEVLMTAPALMEKTDAADPLKDAVKDKSEGKDNGDAMKAAGDEWAWFNDPIDWTGAFNSNGGTSETALPWDDTMAF